MSTIYVVELWHGLLRSGGLIAFRSEEKAAEYAKNAKAKDPESSYRWYAVELDERT